MGRAALACIGSTRRRRFEEGPRPILTAGDAPKKSDRASSPPFFFPRGRGPAPTARTPARRRPPHPTVGELFRLREASVHRPVEETRRTGSPHNCHGNGREG